MLTNIPFLNKYTINLTRKGFTLAEILVTLAIIGIVAVLTIPSLIQNIQENQYKTAWKKTFSSFNQATIKLMNDNNGTMLGVNGAVTVRTLRDKYINYLAYSKICGFNTTLGSCWHSNGDWQYLDGAVIVAGNNEAGFILNDGTLLNFGWVSDPNCNTSQGMSQTIKWCNKITFDINGFKGPNMIGKDIFKIYILKDKILPEGANGDMNENRPSVSCPDDGISFGGFSYPGAGCAAKYLTQ